MKTKIAILLLSCLSALGQNLTSLQDYTTLTGSNAGSAISISGVALPSTTFFLQTGTITNAPAWQTNVVIGVTNIVNTTTNVVNAKIRVSLDGSNWIVVTNLRPLGTNAQIGTFNISSYSLPIYMQSLIVNSNAIPTGLFKQ